MGRKKCRPFCPPLTDDARPRVATSLSVKNWSKQLRALHRKLERQMKSRTVMKCPMLTILQTRIAGRQEAMVTQGPRPKQCHLQNPPQTQRLTEDLLIKFTCSNSGFYQFLKMN